ncbi:MAG: aminotransferase class V-fold PLP-dependent enzyme, partial [Gammaproteobacteria bacterium]
GAIGLGAAIDYVRLIGLDAIAAHERALLAYATDVVSEIEGLRLVGTARDKAGILSFELQRIHPHDIGSILDHEGVAIRAGHHCAMPVMRRYCLPATARASLAMYNTREDIDALVRGIRRVKEVFNQ